MGLSGGWETGTIGIGARAGSFICAKDFIIYHSSVGPETRPRFRPVIPGSRSDPAGGSRSHTNWCVFVLGPPYFLSALTRSCPVSWTVAGRVVRVPSI